MSNPIWVLFNGIPLAMVLRKMWSLFFIGQFKENAVYRYNFNSFVWY
jgi:hypothetical protein